LSKISKIAVNQRFLKISSCLLPLILNSCSYQLGSGAHTLSIPFAGNDENGEFTRTLILAASSNPSFQYQNVEGEYELKVQLSNGIDETIGYRRVRLKSDGSVSKNIRSTEGRRKISAVVTLKSNLSGKKIFGPKVVQAFVDYDYVDGDSVQDLAFTLPDGTRDTTLRFSLGQLEERFSAKSAAVKPLYIALSRKIVEEISRCALDERS